MSKRAWLLFAALQTIGYALTSYGTVYSPSVFDRGAWLIGFLLLLPGNLAAMAVDPTLIHVRSAYILHSAAIACNAMLWIMCSAVWWTLRRATPKSMFPAIRPSLKIACVVGILVLFGIVAVTLQGHRVKDAAALSQLYGGKVPISKGAPLIPASTLSQLASANFTVVRELRYLPAPVKESFCNIEECEYVGSKFDMVNPDERMSTDDLLPGVSNKRLVFAAVNRDSAIIVYERGGYFNVLRTTILDFKNGRTWGTTLNPYSIRNLQDLRTALSKDKHAAADAN